MMKMSACFQVFRLSWISVSSPYSLLPAATVRASTKWRSGCYWGCRRSWKGWRRARCWALGDRSTCSSNKPWTPKTSADSSQGGRPGCRPKRRWAGLLPASCNWIKFALYQDLNWIRQIVCNSSSKTYHHFNNLCCSKAWISKSWRNFKRPINCGAEMYERWFRWLFLYFIQWDVNVFILLTFLWPY